MGSSISFRAMLPLAAAAQEQVTKMDLEIHQVPGTCASGRPASEQERNQVRCGYVPPASFLELAMLLAVSPLQIGHQLAVELSLTRHCGQNGNFNATMQASFPFSIKLLRSHSAFIK